MIGAVSGIFISFLSIWFVNRRMLNIQVAVAIKQDINTSVPGWKKKLYKRIAFSLLIVSIILTSYSVLSSIELNASMFLVSGALFLFGLVLIIYQWIDYQKLEKRDDSLTYNSLVLKNAGRNKARSIASIVLLALGTFVVIITGANRKTYFEAEYSNSSGTGGYLFWAETSVPIAYNLNSVEGKSKSGFNPDDLPEDLKFTQFYNLDGDDASCLNLNQVKKPRILGVNALEFSQRGSFSFAKLMKDIEPDKAWQALYKSEEKNVVPAIADQTVLTWGLKKAVGDTLVYLNERGEKINFVIIGGLSNSIFQGNLLISDSLFKFHFPSAGGSKIMLIDAPNEQGENIRYSLSNTLSDYGLEITPTKQRLAEFNSITNTYLSVFMSLGGLGMIIGTVGLGIVILRNIQERKSELALMQALGFTKNQLFTIILKENVFVFATGITIGTLAAFIGILPGILSPSFEIPGIFMFVLITLVILNGFVWFYFPVKKALKFKIIQILREE
jgi:ABC-type antimicrobial peptide transport system permease subunit